jgi:hypothetical protein
VPGALSARTLPRLLAPVLVPAGCVAERPADPVVLSGAGVPRLRGVAPAKVLAFRFLNGAWAQVPVQVDERAEPGRRRGDPVHR